MTQHKSKILSIGTVVPKNQYQQKELADWMAEALDQNDERLKRKLSVLYRKTAIETRHSVLADFRHHQPENRLFKSKKEIPSVEERLSIYKEEVLQLSIQAVKECLIDIDPKIVSHLIFVSCTGMTAPGVEIQLKQQMNLSQNVQTHAINFVGCYAAFSALKLADAICKSAPSASVLIVSTELCTIHFQNRAEEDFILSNSLFSDGSAAALVSSRNDIKTNSLTILEQKQIHLYQGKNDMAWDIHSDGFLMRLSTYVPDLVHSNIKSLLSTLLDSYDINLDIIKHWAIHPGGRKILEVCQKELGLTHQALSNSYSTLKHYGNMSAPTILFVLKESLENLDKVEQDYLFACGFGPGLTLEGALLQFT